MKKKRMFYAQGWNIGFVRKIGLKMKLTFLFVLIGFFNLVASESYSQLAKLSISLNNATIEQVLAEIEDNSEFNFVYNRDAIDLERKVNVNYRDAKIDNILNDLFENTDVKHYLIDRIIVLSTVSELIAKKQESHKVTGKVTDSSGLPLPGVTVVVKGTTKGAVTNVDGEYTIFNIPDDAILQFSFVGMKTQEITFAGKTSINIVMEEESIGIDEVVAVGYGTMKKSDLTYSVAKVDGGTLTNRPVARVDALMVGQMAGVQVTQSSGHPGKAPVIRVRGVGSISAGNSPLYVIDGFAIEDEDIIANLSMNSVESIEVLKDAAAASIYGSRGANGVVIITTKSGKEGKVGLNYNGYVGIQLAETKLDLLNGPEFAEYVVEARENAWVDAGNDPDVPYNSKTLRGKLAYDEAWLDPSTVKSYDAQDWVFNPASIMSHQVSLTGGAEKSRYYASADYLSQKGIARNTKFDRFTLQTNVSFDPTDFLSIGIKLEPSYSISNDKSYEGKGGVIMEVVHVPALQAPYAGSVDSDYTPSIYNIINNGKRADAFKYLIDETQRGQLLSNIYTEIKLLPGLKFKTSIGMTYVSWERNKVEPIAVTRSSTYSFRYTGLKTNWLSESLLTYNKEFNENNVLSLMAGFTAQKEKYEYSYIRGTGFANEKIYTLNAATVIDRWKNTETEWGLLSYLARATYNYQRRYFVTASIRRDGSSRFGKKYRWGIFPSFSAGWRINEESFMDPVADISTLKLRVSWGQSGNNLIGDYAYYGTMDSGNYPFSDSEEITGGYSPSTIENMDLGWEKTVAYDLGIDFGVFSDRIFLSADYYINNTSDLLLDVPVPTTTGFSSSLQNVGEVQNKGVELELKSHNLNDELKWNTTLSFTYNKNEVVKMGPNGDPIISGRGSVNYTGIGEAIGSLYMYDAIGVWNTQEEIDSNPHYSGSRPGDVRVRDVNDDGAIDSSDKTILGQPMPKYFWGFTNDFTYKNFDLNILINGSGGNKVLCGIGREWDTPNKSHLTKFKNWVNRWKSPEDPGDGKTPRATESPTGASNPEVYTDRWLYDGDYWRIKNITLGYSLPKRIVSKCHLSKARIYISAENLFLKTDYTYGWSPEPDEGEGDAISGAGLDYCTYPNARMFTAGVNIEF